MKIIKEVISELISVFSGKTIDVIIPPVLFLVLIKLFSLEIALIGSLLLSIIFLFTRIKNKDNLVYAIGGLIGVIFASTMTYISDNASNFFLPDIIGTFTLIVVTSISIILKRPIAAYVSHITRSWDINWFKRDDVRPAYMEVSIFWLVFFISRLSVEVYLYFSSTVDELVFANVILGLPVTIFVLTVSYVYGIWRLHNLKGPGIDEFLDNKEPPYRGQRKGF